MTSFSTRAALLAGALAAASPALALPDPFQPTPPFAFESATFNDSWPHDSRHSYVSNYGSAKTVSADYTDKIHPLTVPPTYITTTLATATVSYAGYPYIALTATNPVNPAGSASAHGELGYQYLASIPVIGNSTFTVGDAYLDVVTIHALSSIHTNGPSTQLSLAASARASMAQAAGGGSFTTQVGDGSNDVVYNSDKTYDVTAPGQYVGDVTVNGVVYADFVGSLRLYATVFGTTTTTSGISDGIYPPGVPAGMPYTFTVNNHPGQTGTLTIDPLIGVNAAFVHQYGLSGGTITLSPGVANASAPSGAPEPGVWAMLLGGFGLTASAMRRRRAVAA